MIVHCSLWKFKDGTSPELVEDIVQRWRALEAIVPSVRKIEAGPDLGNWDENYDIAALIYFDGPEGYESYRTNEDHLAFAMEFLVPNIDGLHMRAAVQFTLPDMAAQRDMRY
ncbi:Dabb family protein [Sphingomonadaceae bacterium jetA1]|jgi:hypothetical protein|uniref:Dabb family protein n=1 Tax=Facivitalis istanbulensis TaxID=3075838 RepID=UPI0034983027